MLERELEDLQSKAENDVREIQQKSEESLA